MLAASSLTNMNSVSSESEIETSGARGGETIVLLVQVGRAVEDGRCRQSLQNWSAGLVTKLLEVIHGQWLYCNVHVHDTITGEKTRLRKEDIRKEVEYQLALGGECLAEKDMYLLEINLDDLDHMSGEDHIYWLMALQTARKAWQLREERQNEVVERGN